MLAEHRTKGDGSSSHMDTYTAFKLAARVCMSIFVCVENTASFCHRGETGSDCVATVWGLMGHRI